MESCILRVSCKVSETLRAIPEKNTWGGGGGGGGGERTQAIYFSMGVWC